jgi:6-phosphogluconolactonase
MNNPAIYRAVTTVKPPPRRMTLGYSAIAAAREVWVLISGKGKVESLKLSLPPAATTPLGRVMSLREQTTIYTDVQTGPKNN